MKFFFQALLLFIITFSGTEAFASKDAAKKFVEALSNEVIDTIAKKSSEKEKAAALEKIFVRSVDTDWMGRFVLGQNYRVLKEGKKQEYLGLYRNFLVNTYVPRFKDYTGEKLKVLGIREEKSNEYFVQTELVRPKGKPAARVDYRIRATDGNFRVIDIIGEGVSLITTQRSDFAGVISQKGVDSFIEMLRARSKGSN